MLRHLKEKDAAERLERAVAAVIAEGRDVTYDMKPNRDDPTAVGTREMAQAICRKIAAGGRREVFVPGRICRKKCSQVGLFSDRPVSCKLFPRQSTLAGELGFDSLHGGGVMTNDRWKAGLLVLALLAGLGVICPLLVAPHIPLVDPDEGLHASIAQEMVESGDWTVPHLLNEPFLDKPILYFWAIAASLKIFGMSEAAVRLPGLLFGMLGTLTTAAIAWRMLGRRTGLIAGVFYASMILPLALVQVPAHDVALVPWVNLALLCFWESDRGGIAQRRRLGRGPRRPAWCWGWPF